MRLLITITALLEAVTGAALLFVPSIATSSLLGTSLTEPGGILLGRIGGAALISLATACWLSRNHAQFALVMIKALVFYNAAAASLLVYAKLVDHFPGVALWPAVILHIALLIWCLVTLRHK